MPVYTESDQGKQRDRNEDFVHSFEVDGVQVLMVADGLGGHSAGHIASEMAATQFSECFQKKYSGEISEEVVEQCFENAEDAVHRRIEENAELEGMGCTLVTAVVKDGKAVLGNAGDSRAYLIRDSEIQQISEDHTEVQFHGMAGRRRKSTYLYNVIGGGDEGVQVDIFEQDLSQGDVLLLCTDGLTDELGDSRIQRVVSKSDSVSDAGRTLVEYANKSGGSDNITVALYSPELVG
jgi:protein phosphatase